METWKIIENTNYEISKEGRMRNATTKKIMKPTYDKYGYLRTTKKDINGSYFYPTIHQLVARAFIPNPENKKEINHINGIKDDNRVENLEWCTRLENIRHSWNIGLRSGRKGKPMNAKKTAAYQNNVLLGIYNSAKEAAKEYNMDASVVSRIACGLRPSTKDGMTFMYLPK